MKVYSLIKLYMRDASLRMNLSIFLGIILNGIYIVYNTVLGIVYKDVRFITASAFYLVLLSTRYLTFDIDAEDGRAENEELVGVLLTVLAFPMSGIIVYTLFSDSGSSYPVALAVPFGLYFVYSLIRVLHGLLKLHAHGSEITFSAYAVRVIALLYSFFNFQVSLLPSLNISERARTLMNILTGSGVSFFVFLISFVSLRRKRRRN